MVLFLASTTFCQYSEGLEIWYGGEFTDYSNPDSWNNIITVRPDMDFNIFVYAQCLTDTTFVFSFCLPLGINTDYVTNFNITECTFEYPLTAWDYCNFEDEHCDSSAPFWPIVPMPGVWCSLSMLGLSNTSGPPNPWGHWYPNIGHIATISAHSSPDTLLIDSTICDALGLGSNHWQPSNATDTNSGGWWIMHDNYACLLFNQSLNYFYLPGDVNMFNDIWPPSALGGDVTYLVNYFRGNNLAIPCLLDGFWCSADANGDCIVMGSDVIKLVNYFKGLTSLSYCAYYIPMWFSTEAASADGEPTGWPNCEAPPVMGKVVPTGGSK